MTLIRYSDDDRRKMRTEASEQVRYQGLTESAR